MREKSGAHFIADLERVRADRRSQPGEYLARRNRHRSQGRFQHAGLQATPAGMRGSDHRAGPVAEQDRQAIGRHHGTDRPGPMGKGRIRRRQICRLGGVDRVDAMHLLQPAGLGRQMPAQFGPIGGDTSGIVADVITQIEAVPRRRAEPAAPRCLHRPDIGRNRPVRNQQVSHNAACRAGCACLPAAALPTASSGWSADEPGRAGSHAAPGAGIPAAADCSCHRPGRRPADG